MADKLLSVDYNDDEPVKSSYAASDDPASMFCGSEAKRFERPDAAPDVDEPQSFTTEWPSCCLSDVPAPSSASLRIPKETDDDDWPFTDTDGRCRPCTVQRSVNDSIGIDRLPIRELARTHVHLTGHQSRNLCR